MGTTLRILPYRRSSAISPAASRRLSCSGTRDLFLSNTVRTHRGLRQAGIAADLHIFEAATHVMFMAGPQAEDQQRELRLFVDRYWRRSG